MKGKMPGGRARLPPTPSHTSNIRHLIDASSTGYTSETSNLANPSSDAYTNSINGPDLMHTQQVLDRISDHERQYILNVLERNNEVQQRDASRLMTLRAELQLLRRKGAIKVNGGSLDRPIIESKSSCARCRLVFGYINRGAECNLCRSRVCRDCRIDVPHTKNDWVCIICFKEMELKAANGEWISDISREVPIRCEPKANEYLSASEVIRRSIRRSWTITSSQQVYNNQTNVNRNGGVIEAQRAYSAAPVNSYDSYDSNEQIYSTNNRTNQTVNYRQHPNMDYQNNEYYERTSPQRRVLRQSTLPNNLPYPDQYQHQNNTNLMPPISPNHQISPQYSPYNTDTEDMMDSSNPDLRQIRYPIRRQSTLPNRPIEHHYQQQIPLSAYFSTSPNRNYSRSPEKSDSEQQLGRYPPPFVRQSTFPSNSSNEQQQQQQQFNTHRSKILPTSPNRMGYNKSPDHGSEPDFQKRHHNNVVRQNTLPNPDQHLKLLPTSPPKRQLSPQYKKRSPEMLRQNTLPNPENTLNIPQSTKFLPLSPRLKQSFLFPQPKQGQRQFLSQQNVPTVIDDPYSSTGSVSCIPREQQVKMMKVRSHSNEEYSASRLHSTEGRRLLPEIPRNRSRSPSRLVRQDNVKEEMRANEQRSPSKRTFAEAKQNLPDYDDMNQMGMYHDSTMYSNEDAFCEADEDDTFEMQRPYQQSYYEEENMAKHQVVGAPNVHSVESYLNDSLPEYSPPADDSSWYGSKERPHRRGSRDYYDNEMVGVQTIDDVGQRRKPETMRSISEDAPTRNAKQAVTRRTLSHPEKESLSQNLRIVNDQQPKLPSPKQLADIMERTKREKPSKIPSPRRKNYKSVDIPETSPPGIRSNLHMQKRDSKSFDSGSSFRSDIDDDTNSCSAGVANDGKKLLPTLPIWSKALASNQSVNDNNINIESIKNDTDNKRNTTPATSGDSDNNKTDDNDIKSEEQSHEHEHEHEHEHKTTLGEAEIQSAVEAAAVIFKKVVLQRRAAKKANEEGERNRNVPLLLQDDVSDYEGNGTALKMTYPESDDYKLVFISSDSSSLDDMETSSQASSTSSNNHHSISLDDCDWDYFEPSATTTTKTIFRDLSHSPFVSPSFQRRCINISDINTTDEEFLAQSSSPTSSDGFVDIRRKLSRFKRSFRNTTTINKNNGSCSGSHHCECGHTKYVPIPVAVPIFVIGDEANSSDVRAIQKKQAAELFQLWNNAAPDLLLAQQNSKHGDSHKNLTNDFLKSYVTQVEAVTTSTIHTNTIIDANTNNGNETCMDLNAQPLQKAAEQHGCRDGDTTLANAESYCNDSNTECKQYNNNSNNTNQNTNNTFKDVAAHNDRPEQTSNFSIGPTVEEKRAINSQRIKASSPLDNDEIELNSIRLERKNRHFELKDDAETVDCVTNALKIGNVTDVKRLNNHFGNLNNSSMQNIDTKNSEYMQNVKQNPSAGELVLSTKNSNLISALTTIQSTNKYRSDPLKCSNVQACNTKSTTEQMNTVAIAHETDDDDDGDDSGAVNVSGIDMAGYLHSESMFSSSSCDSDTSELDNKQPNGKKIKTKSIKRNYDVSNAITKTSKENEKHEFTAISVSGSSDCEDLLSNSAQEHPSCSSAPEASDSDDDDDDKSTNIYNSTLADRRPKSKGFYKVFVVNKKNGSSDSDSPSTNVNSTDDSSDNDTDTGIVLNYMKPLSENSVDTIDDTTTESYDDIDMNDQNEIVLYSIKRIDDEQFVNDDKNMCSKELNDGGVVASKINEQSSDDENEQTIIERMPNNAIDTSMKVARDCESNASFEHLLNEETTIAMQQNKLADLHNQSATAINETIQRDVHSQTMQTSNITTDIGIDLCASIENQVKIDIVQKCGSVILSETTAAETCLQLQQLKSEEMMDTERKNNSEQPMAKNEKLNEVELNVDDTENGTSQREQVIEMAAKMNKDNKKLENDPISVGKSSDEEQSVHDVDYIPMNGELKGEHILLENNEMNEIPLIINKQSHCNNGDTTANDLPSDSCLDETNAVLDVKNSKNDELYDEKLKFNNKHHHFGVDDEAKVDVVSPDETSFCVMNGDSNVKIMSATHTEPIGFMHESHTDFDGKTLTPSQLDVLANEMCEERERQVKCKQHGNVNVNVNASPNDLGEAIETSELNDHGVDIDFPYALRQCDTETVTNTHVMSPGVQTSMFNSMPIQTQVDGNADNGRQTNVRSSVENERANSTDGGGVNLQQQTTKYTSLVMITQDIRKPTTLPIANVNIVASDTTHIVADPKDSIIVQHTNRLSDDEYEANSLAGYFTRSLEEDSFNILTPTTKRRPIVTNYQQYGENSDSVYESDASLSQKSSNQMANNSTSDESMKSNDGVTVVTGKDTLSAVICLEDGLADDDSWIDSAEDDEEFQAQSETDSETEYAEELAMCSAMDREEQLRGYNRASIDFTLHTIVEESCEDSEFEANDKKKNRMSASELEKYFFFGLGDGRPSTVTNDARDDSISETSSLCSDGMESIGATDTSNVNETNDMVSSRLEKYFLSTFMGFSMNERDQNSDGSGSVGSDSEGHASPEQRRKRLVRARGTPRSHNSSLDNLLNATKDDGHELNASGENPSMNIDSNDSSETDTCEETVIHLEKDSNPNDTLKRKKQNKKKNSDSDENKKSTNGLSDDESVLLSGKNSVQSDSVGNYNSAASNNKKQSRDSGFIGSNDDLLKTDDANKVISDSKKIELEGIKEESKESLSQTNVSQMLSSIPSTTLTRKDSFNNYSSDEETNLMMSKLRQFIKTLVASNANAQQLRNTSKSSTPMMSQSNTPKTGTPIPKPRSKAKPPQLVYFENELTRLMKTVPGINDDQVREIVEYLSSEETWSDSYDSSDYTSSDLEGAASSTSKSELQEQISASCQQIIKKFEGSVGDREGDIGDGGLFDENQCLNHETALVYHKLVTSFSKMNTTNEKPPKDPTHSPPIFAKVMSHIGTRLVALMHEVSSSESHTSQSPKPSTRYHKKLQQKISATTTDDDDDDDVDDEAAACDNHLLDTSGENYLNLPRSKSHDLLLSGARLQHHQSSSGVSDTAAEEKEASDYERFSWRGSFESALLANGDSRTKLTLLDRDNSSSASALAAKRRSAGDLLFNQCSLSREQLDRVRSCGSIGASGTGSNDNMDSSKLWGSSDTGQRSTSARQTKFPDSDDESSDEERRHHIMGNRSTLPRSLQTTTSASTNSLPRNSTTNSQLQMQKSQSAYQFTPNNVKSARYRAPGFSRSTPVSKKANTSLGLSSLYTKRDNTRPRRIQSIYNEGVSSPEAGKSPVIGNRSDEKKASPKSSNSPSAGPQSPSSPDHWPAQSDEDIDRLVAMHQNRSSLSSLGVRSDSMASVYSGAGEGRYGTVTVKGQVEFGMQYNYKQGTLEIYVAQCKDLAAVDTKRNRSDPYVKVYLLPDKSKYGKRKTKVKKHTLNPIFDETLKYLMPLNSLESRTLWLTVWHSDMFGRNDFLGEVAINLQGKVFDNPQSQWYSLQERSEPYDDESTYRGDIIVGLKFVPPDAKSSHFTRSSIGSGLRKFGSIKSSPGSRNTSTKGSLHVLVKEAKNLSPVKASGICDAFCKSYLLPDKNRNSKQKTPVVKRSLSPIWNYTFAYDDISLDELSERALELTIWDHDRLASNEFLGGVRFSLGTGRYYGRTVDWMDSTGKELSLWQSMINRPNFWVEGCVVLRSTFDNVRNTY